MRKMKMYFICISDNNVSMKTIEIFYVIWHLVMLIHTSALINACTKHFKSIQNNGEKTKKIQNAREGETTNSYA